MKKSSRSSLLHLLVTHLILMALFMGPLWAQASVMVFPQVQQIAAPDGLEFKTAPSRSSRTTQTIAEATVFRCKAYLDTPEGRFFLSEKSYEKVSKGAPAFWAYIFGVSSGRNVKPPDGTVAPDRPPTGHPSRGGTADNQWAYEFLAKPEADAKIARYSTAKGRRVLLANDEWIVTSSFTSLGMGRGKCELAFYDACTLVLESRVSVPNDVIHIDWNSRRRQFVAVTTCGEGGTKWIKFPDHCAQALVVVDLTARKLESAPLWRDSGNSAFDWEGACTPRWTQGGIEIPYAPDNDKTVPIGRIQFRAREFADLKVTFFKESASASRARLSGVQAETAGLAYEGIVATHNTAPYEDGASPMLQASSNTVTNGDRSGIHLVRPTASGGILDLNLSTLKSNYHKVANSPVRSAGIFADGVVRCMTPQELILIAPERRSVITIMESGKTDPNLKVDFNDREAYLARWVPKVGGKPEIRRVNSSGNVESEKVVLPGDLNWLDYLGFTLNANRRSIAVMHGDGDNNMKMYWKEFSWKDGSLVSPPYEWDGGKSMHSGDHIQGVAPDIMKLTSGITDYSTAGRAFTVTLADTRTKRKYIIGGGPQRGEFPLAAVMEGQNSAVVLSSGYMTAQLERVDLKSGNVSKIADWAWDYNDGAPFFEKSSNWLFVPRKDGYQMFQLFDKLPFRKLADIYFEGDGNYAIILPDGTYAGSPGCERMLRLHTSSGTVDANELAQWHNRPGEVLKALNGNISQVELLGQVTRRWMNRSGFDPNAAEPPATALPSVRCTRLPRLWASSDELALPMEIRAGNAPIREVILRANGALVASIPAKDIPPNANGVGSVAAKIKLVYGLNWIEVTAVDSNGRCGNTERFRTILKASTAAAKRYVIAMGVSKYAKQELNLDYAAKDATELLEVLRVGDKSRATETLLLTDAEVGPQALKKTADFLAKSAENDEVILFCAGHGMLDEKLNYIFAGHDFDPERPGQTGIKLDDLVSVITASPARKRLMLLDTCQAGLVGEAEESILAQNAANLAPGVRSIRVRGSLVPDATRQTTRDAQRFVEELYLLPGLIRGMNIIGASGGAQFAYEMEQLKNGVFTAAAIEALRSMKADVDKDGSVTVGELRDYLARRVPELTGNAQRPSIVASERDQDFAIIRN